MYCGNDVVSTELEREAHRGVAMMCCPPSSRAQSTEVFLSPHCVTTMRHHTPLMEVRLCCASDDSAQSDFPLPSSYRSVLERVRGARLPHMGCGRRVGARAP